MIFVSYLHITLFSNLLIIPAFKLEPSSFSSSSEYAVVKSPQPHITHHIQPFLSASIENRFLISIGKAMAEDETENIVSLEKEKLKSPSLICNRNGGK